MSNRTISLDDAIYEFLCKTTLREDEILRELRRETAKLPRGEMQISPDQGQFMGLLVEIIGARRAIEIGVFTGYSAICVARAMGEKGRLIACDVSDEWTRIAQRYWKRAGLEDR